MDHKFVHHFGDIQKRYDRFVLRTHSVIKDGLLIHTSDSHLRLSLLLENGDEIGLGIISATDISQVNITTFIESTLLNIQSSIARFRDIQQSTSDQWLIEDMQNEITAFTEKFAEITNGLAELKKISE